MSGREPPSALSLACKGVERSLCWLFLCSSLLGIAGSDDVQAQGSSLKSIPAYLSGSGQIPPNDSTNTAYGIFQYETGSTQVQARIECSPSFGAVAAWVHGPATPTSIAPPIADLGSFMFITNITTVVTWPEGTNYLTNITFVCSNLMSLSPHQMEDLEAGRCYVNLTSPSYTQGELRGQITRSIVLNPPKLLSSGGLSVTATGPYWSHSDSAELSSNLVDWATPASMTATTLHSYLVPFPDGLYIDSGITVEFLDRSTNRGDKRFYRVWKP